MAHNPTPGNTTRRDGIESAVKLSQRSLLRGTSHEVWVWPHGGVGLVFRGMQDTVLPWDVLLL